MAEIDQSQIRLEKAIIASGLAARCLEERHTSMLGLRNVLGSKDKTAAIEAFLTLRVIVDAIHEKLFE
jgi:hypothetical protein